MNEPMYAPLEDLSDVLLPCQYNELLRKSAGLRGEYRLMWAVLDDAIRCYLANMSRATPRQRREFEEVRRWFLPLRDARQAQDLFAFQTICDVLGIDSRRLARRLESLRRNAAPLPHWQAAVSA